MTFLVIWLFPRNDIAISSNDMSYRQRYSYIATIWPALRWPVKKNRAGKVISVADLALLLPEKYFFFCRAVCGYDMTAGGDIAVTIWPWRLYRSNDITNMWYIELHVANKGWKKLLWNTYDSDMHAQVISQRYVISSTISLSSALLSDIVMRLKSLCRLVISVQSTSRIWRFLFSPSLQDRWQPDLVSCSLR